MLREMVQAFAGTLMSADADEVCGAAFGMVSPGRVNRRNGYRTRRWDTRVGTIDLWILKLREGSCFPDWLLDAAMVYWTMTPEEVHEVLTALGMGDQEYTTAITKLFHLGLLDPSSR